MIVAFHQALKAHEQEGGNIGRGVRCRRNSGILVKGLLEFGFVTLLPDALQAPIIVTFHMPADPRFAFQNFYDPLNKCALVIYPGKLTVADSISGYIGRLGEAQMRAAIEPIRATLTEMGVKECAYRQAKTASS